MSVVKIFLISLLLLLCFKSYAQLVEDYDESHIESSLPNFSGFNVNTEFYNFNVSEKAFYLVGNGKIEFGDRDYVNIELIGASYRRDSQQHSTAGDFNISYTRNYYSKNFLDSGFQGVSPTLKIILPTGNADYAGLFGYWIVEPSVYYSWLLKNEKFFISHRWRAFLPLIDVKNVADPPQLIRFEPRFGYENNKFWISITLDNRIILNQGEYVLFYRLDGGIKLTKNSGFTIFFTQRIFNDVLFEKYAGIGYYHIL